MSDYDFDGEGSSYPLVVLIPSILIIVGVMLAFLFLFVIPTLNDYSKHIPTQDQINQIQQLEKQTEKTLADPNVTCLQIGNMRQSHVQAKSEHEDPLYWTSNFDTARDLWNAKNCGNHWGWFES